MDIGGWLRSLGLEQYEAAFHENAIDFSVLPDLTERILRSSASCLAIAANCCERSQTSKLSPRVLPLRPLRHQLRPHRENTAANSAIRR